ncbi:MAG: LON peptidase substrate-binding domain-containing protein [Burkholderiales bacterium]
MLFPGGRLPLRIFEQRYVDMFKVCLRDNQPFGVCAIREGAEVGAPATPFEIGTLAKIGEWEMPQLGLFHIVARGGRRFRTLDRRVERNGLQQARIELVEPERDAPVPASCAACVRVLERLIAEHPELLAAPHELHSSAWVSARLAELVPLPVHAKQELLELSDGAQRLERLNALLRADAREDS